MLGAGGVLGAAWTVGALAAVEQELGWDAREAEVLIGTSAGSVLAAALACGVSVEELVGHQRGLPDPRIAYDLDEDSGGPLPPFPRPVIGSPRGALSTTLRPWRTTPMAALATVMPRGRGSIAAIGDLVDGLLPGGGWAPHKATWIVAMDYESGRRTPFGQVGHPLANLRDAVMASCAIPGWYEPVTVGRRQYVDGGVCSPTSVDLLARLGLDEVIVLSPMASLSYDRPDSVTARIERRFRRLSTKRVVGEVKKVAAHGTHVRLLGPGAEDLAVIGANMMDPRRRPDVFETSLRTSAAALRASAGPAAGPAAHEAC